MEAEPGPPLKTKIKRASGGVGVRVEGVGGVEDLGGDFVFLVFERHLADGGAVAERVAAELELVRRDNRRFFADFVFVVRVRFGLISHPALRILLQSDDSILPQAAEACG